MCLNRPCPTMSGRYKILLPGLLEELCHEAGPPGLMTGAQPRSGVPMKIFVKQNQVSPPGILLKFLKRAVERPPSVAIAQKNMLQRSRDFRAHIPERHLLAGAGRTFHLESVSVIMMKFLQRFDHQKIGRKPNRPAPIGIPAERSALRFSRLIIHPVFAAVDREDVRVRRVKLRKRANTVR